MRHDPVSEPSGTADDYGYDLAHEVAPAPDPHLAEAPRPPGRGARTAHEVDVNGDYGYDEAHDL
jgi:hypothetical protein